MALTEEQQERKDRREEAGVLLDIIPSCSLDATGAILLPPPIQGENGQGYQCHVFAETKKRLSVYPILSRIVNRACQTEYGTRLTWNSMIYAITDVDLGVPHHRLSPLHDQAIELLNRFYNRVMATEEEALQWLLDHAKSTWKSRNELAVMLTTALGSGPGNEAWCWAQIEAGNYARHIRIGNYEGVVEGVRIRVKPIKKRLQELQGEDKPEDDEEQSPLTTMEQDFLSRDDEIKALTWLLENRETDFQDYVVVLNRWAGGTGLGRGKLHNLDRSYDALEEKYSSVIDYTKPCEKNIRIRLAALGTTLPTEEPKFTATNCTIQGSGEGSGFPPAKVTIKNCTAVQGRGDLTPFERGTAIHQSFHDDFVETQILEALDYITQAFAASKFGGPRPAEFVVARAKIALAQVHDNHDVRRRLEQTITILTEADVSISRATEKTVCLTSMGHIKKYVREAKARGTCHMDDKVLQACMEQVRALGLPGHTEKAESAEDMSGEDEIHGLHRFLRSGRFNG